MYKTNEEQLNISLDEFISEWYNKEDYILADIREENEKDFKVKLAFEISMYDIPNSISMAPTYISCIICSDDVEKSKQVAKFIKNNDLDNFFYLDATINELIESIPELKG
jgi:hypothetical protein